MKNEDRLFIGEAALPATDSVPQETSVPARGAEALPGHLPPRSPAPQACEVWRSGCSWSYHVLGPLETQWVIRTEAGTGGGDLGGCFLIPI